MGLLSEICAVIEKVGGEITEPDMRHEGPGYKLAWIIPAIFLFVLCFITKFIWGLLIFGVLVLILGNCIANNDNTDNDEDE